MSTFAFSVVRMAVFCPPLSKGDDDTHKKVLFYHPKTDDSNTREIHIGVFETIAYFGRDKAGADVTLIETTNCKICLSEPEPGVFIAIALKKPSEYDPEHSVMDVLPGVMELPEGLLKRLPQLLYRLLVHSLGPLKKHAELFGIINTRCCMYSTCKLFLQWLERDGIPLSTLLGGVRYTELGIEKQSSADTNLVDSSRYVGQYALAECIKQRCGDVSYFFSLMSDGTLGHVVLPPSLVPSMALWAQRCVLWQQKQGETGSAGIGSRRPAVVPEDKVAAMLPRYGVDNKRDYGTLWSMLDERERRALRANARGELGRSSFVGEASSALYPLVLTDSEDPNIDKPELLPLVWLTTDDTQEGFETPEKERVRWGVAFTEETLEDKHAAIRPYRLIIVRGFRSPVCTIGLVPAERVDEYSYRSIARERLKDLVATFEYINSITLELANSSSSVGASPSSTPEQIYSLFLSMCGCTMGGVSGQGHEFVTFSPATLSYKASFPDFPSSFYSVLSTRTIRMLRQRVIEERERDRGFRANRISLYHALSVMTQCFFLLASRPEIVDICASCPCGDPTFEGNEAESDRPGQTWLSVHQQSDSTLRFTVVDGKCTNIVDAMERIGGVALARL